MNDSVFEKKVIPWLGTLWFLVSIDSFFLWWDFSRIIRIIAFLGMLYASIKLSKKCSATTYNLPIFLSLLLYIPWLLGFFNNQFVLINKLFGFVPLLLLLFWPKDVFNKWYLVLRKVIIFFAVGSSIVSILSLLGVLQYLPHFTFEGQSELHRSRGFMYYVYGAFVTIYSEGGGISSRACGPIQEPGHWAVFLGLFYLIDWHALRKRNIWFIIGGLFTFSSAFWVMFLSVEVLNLFSKRDFLKTVRYFSVIIIAILIMLLVLPQNIKDQVTYLFFERNLESVYEGFEEAGSLDEALDARAASYSIERYYNLSVNDFLFGSGYRDNTVAISDYRGTILFMGLIGLILSIIPSVLIILHAKWRLALSLLASLLLIYLHRGWMYYTPYIYFLAFLAVSLSSMPIAESNEYLIKQVEDNSNSDVVLENP